MLVCKFIKIVLKLFFLYKIFVKFLIVFINRFLYTNQMLKNITEIFKLTIGINVIRSSGNLSIFC